MKLVTLILSLFSKQKNPPNKTVIFDADGVTRTMPDGRIESITWDELQEVKIVTTDEGPNVDDVFWVLSGNGKGCTVPSESVGMKELLNRLQTLPGFNNAAVIQAMGCTQKEKFICWQRK
jgi:hypothetical protein